MKKGLRNTLIIIGSVIGALVLGTGAAYALLSDTPDLEREVGPLEELLPGYAISYAAFDLEAASELYRSSKISNLVRRHGIDEDFEKLEQVAKLEERTQGRLWDALGSRFVWASYPDEEYLLITQPGWKFKAMWRAVLAKGEEKSSDDIPYTVFSNGAAGFFAGDYFWYASSEELLLSSLGLASSPSSTGEEAFLKKSEQSVLVYGLSRKSGKYLKFEELSFAVSETEEGLAAVVKIEEPSGVIGGFMARAEPPDDYSNVPQDAVAFLSIQGLDPYAAWNQAGKLALEDTSVQVLGNIEVEREFATMATDLEDRALLLMQGWDTEKWYGPARWLFSVEASSERTYESWEELVPWLFPYYSDTSLTYGDVSYRYLEFGEDLLPFLYLYDEPALVLADEEALVTWWLDAVQARTDIEDSEHFTRLCQKAGISNPAGYLYFPLFEPELKEYLLYAADRTSGVTPGEVEERLFPLLDALELKAVVMGVQGSGEVLTFTVRTVRGD